MSNWLAGIIGGIIGLALGILMVSIVSVTQQAEQENSIYREGFADGHRVGLRNGKVLKIDEALYEELKARATGRGRSAGAGQHSSRKAGRKRDSGGAA